MKSYTNHRLFISFCALLVIMTFSPVNSDAEVMNNYCSVPPFISQSVPPLVLLTTGRDHKLYYEAFNEAMDLDEDGRVDVGYMHNIDYYGYFDPYKCYTYGNATGLFSPATTSVDKFCVAGQWSGNVLNFLTMSRMDVLRKVLYGGHRSTDTTASTIMERVYIPGDAHSWAKEITGRLCTNGTVYKNMCYNNDNCDSGYSCVDKSQNLIGMIASDATVCPATTVTWSATTNGKLLAARFNHQTGIADDNGTTHLNLLDTFYTDSLGNVVSPLSLVDLAATGNPASTSSKVKYISSFDDVLLNPDNTQTSNTSTIVVGSFKTPGSTSGVWQFAVDGDDGVEFELAKTKNGAGNIVATYYGAHAACFSPGASQSPNTKAFCDTTQASNDNPNLYSAPVCSGDTTKACRMSDDMLLDLTGTCSGLGYGSCIVAPSKAYVCSADTSKGCDPATGLYSPISGTKSCVNQDKGVCVRNLRETTLSSNTNYYFYARQSSGGGLGGIRLWYKKPKDTTWRIFDSTELSFTSPTIASGNECSIRFKSFVDTATTTTGYNRRHLFCSTTRYLGGPPLLRLLQNRDQRMWNWASKERPVCADVIRKLDDSGDIALTVDTTKTDTGKIWDYTVRNEVCKTISPDIRPIDKRDTGASGMETNCRPYKNTSTGVITYKPAGLLQKYGEGKGGKVCSRSFSKVCTSHTDCTTNEGLCIDEAPIYFGLITDSYTKNLSGGMLRKDIWSLTDEINMSTGEFYLPASSSLADYNAKYPQGSIINTFENFKTVGFSYGDNAYSDNSGANAGGSCGWIVNNPLGEGKCRMWGNPIAELMYEGLRYLAGKSDPTTTFIDSSTYQDGGLSVFRQAWGVPSGGNTYRPYGDKDNNNAVFPICSKPFMLVLSDENVSYDSDSVPGSKFVTFTEDAGLPKLNIDVSVLTDVVGANEGIHGTTIFIGDNGTINDFICSPKTVDKLSLLRGLCPEEPTKQGSYYAAGVAYYGKTKFTLNTQQVDGSGNVIVTGKPNVDTYSLVLSSPVPKIVIPINGTNVTIVPIGKSFSGGGVENSCSNKCTSSSIDANGSLVISGCSAAATASTAGSFCPSNQIVDFYVDSILYDSSNNITYAKFRINFEDVEQGADHDMDAIATYEICTGSTCSPALAAGKVKISVSSDYSAGGIDQVMGFVVSGTTEDGTYLVVKDDGVSAAAAVIGGMPLTWQRDFTANSSGSTATLLKSPLWYAAKWGAFRDGDNNNMPNARGEWAQNCSAPNIADCNPDNYYLVVNPLKLEQQLDKALNDILASVSSGTAASILNNSEGSGANLLQAVFYPKKQFSNKTEASWIGELQNLWYFVDPFLNKTSIREDTNQDNVLNLKQDYITKFYFDSSQNKTLVKFYVDANGDGSADSASPVGTDDPDAVKSLWKAGKKLWERNVSVGIDPRTIYTRTDSGFDDSITGFTLFDSASTLKTDATFRGYIQASDAVEAKKIIDYVHGIDQTGYRDRKVTITGCGLSDLAPADSCTREWKLGDIVSSTPRLVSNVKLNTYDLAPPNGYNDSSYKKYIASATYKNRGMVLVGGNDGMLHAFKLGVLSEKADRFTRAQMNDESGNLANALDDLGREMWAFVPKNALPYLRYLGCKAGSGDATYCNNIDYNHVFMVDRTPTVVDASIISDASCAADYSLCDRDATSGSNWTTVVIGGMGIGGANRNASDVCTQGAAGTCIKTPVAGVGWSSYFALDVKDPANPKYMWEFSGDPASGNYLGATITGPAVIRVKATGTATKGDDYKNGKWFAIFASGSTGPIDLGKHQFMGTSDQNLKLFIVDLKSGTLLRTINTGIANAFAGNLSTAMIDTDRSDSTRTGYYSDDAVYIGYVQKDTSVIPNTWTKGGVIRLVTKDNPDPAQWVVSTVIDEIGPVTSSITKLQDRKNSTLWLFFGTGRYFYKNDDPATSVQQVLYGIKEPCYATVDRFDRTSYANIAGGSKNDIDPTCTTSTASGGSGLTDQSGDSSTAPQEKLNVKADGWKVSLDAATTSSLAERVITDPVALTNGNVFFTTFMPSADICKFGGESLIWALKYDTATAPPARTMQGTALMQVSTGAFAEVKMSDAFKNPSNLRLDGRRLAIPIQGVPPTAQGLSLIVNPPPVKRFLHVREK